jgi:hypothetical protein
MAKRAAGMLFAGRSKAARRDLHSVVLSWRSLKMNSTRTRTCTWSFAVSRDRRAFESHVRDLLALEVQSETHDAHREVELTASNQTLENTWLAWIEMPIADGAPITLIGRLHYVDGVVQAVTFEAGDPRPTYVRGDVHRVTAPRPSPPPRRSSSAPPTPTGGAGGAPRPGAFGAFLSQLDTQLQNVGVLTGLLDLIGAAGAEAVGAAAGTIGAPIAILAGLHMVGEAQLFRDQVAYYRGYVLAIADLSRGQNPNARPIETTWFNRGRAEAVRYINEHARSAALMLIRLHQDHSSGQAVVDYLWSDIVRSRIGTEGQRSLARSLKPSF